MLLQGLKMVVLPLIIFSIISGIASLDAQTTGKLGGYAVAYYGVTTIFAVVIGILMSVAVKPGVSDEQLEEATTEVGELAPIDTLLDLVRNLIPANIFYATFAQVIIINLFEIIHQKTFTFMRSYSITLKMMYCYWMYYLPKTTYIP